MNLSLQFTAIATQTLEDLAKLDPKSIAKY
jgi:hypothetical protein